MSIDPLASQAPHLTPYRFSFNNPLNVVDPNGLFETGYDLDSETGQLTEAEGENGKLGGEEYDVIIAEDGTQKIVDKGVIKEENLNTSESGTSNGQTLNFKMSILDVSNMDTRDGIELFKWISKRTNVEYAFNEFRAFRPLAGPLALRYISTSHGEGYEVGGVMTKEDLSSSHLANSLNTQPYFWVQNWHSHPCFAGVSCSKEELLTPSGDGGDRDFARHYRNYNRTKAKIFNWKGRVYKPKFRIFSPEHDAHTTYK